MSLSPDDALQSLVAKNGGVAGQSPGIGGKTIGEGVDIKISDFIDKGTLIKSIAPGGELNGLKGIQEINNAVKMETQSISEAKLLTAGISSQSKGQ